VAALLLQGLDVLLLPLLIFDKLVGLGCGVAPKLSGLPITLSATADFCNLVNDLLLLAFELVVLGPGTGTAKRRLTGLEGG